MLSAVGFLTVLGPARAPDRRTLRWFPLVGAGVGGVLALVWLGATQLWTPGVAAVLVVIADLALTGMLHVDGLADSADGLLPHLDRERRLAVMRTPDIGAFALGVVPTVLLARWAALAADVVEPGALVAVWAAARTLVAVVPALVPYARARGLATSFLDGASAWLALWLAPLLGILIAAHGTTGAVALGGAVLAGAAVVVTARRRIGGFTGDVLGATVVVAETTALLVLAVSP